MAYTISPELYNRYRDEVVRLGMFKVHYEGYQVKSGLSDEEIAKRLGLSVRDVTEIRCIAEVDLLPMDSWEKAEQFKNLRTKKYLSKRAK